MGNLITDRYPLIHLKPEYYVSLVIDVDYRVRQSAALVLQAMVQTDRKKLAPILKQIIGPWLCSLYDTHREVTKTSTESIEVRDGCQIW